MIGFMTAAGKGTRMKALTGVDIPKVLLKINKKPIIAYGIESMEEMGVKKIYVVANNKYVKEFEEAIGGYKTVEILYIEDTEHIMDSVELLAQHVLSKGHSTSENYIYWLADNIFIGDDHKNAIKSIDKKMDNSSEQTGFIVVETKTPQDFITKNLDNSWSEKPILPETNISASGVFMVNNKALKDTSRRSINEGQKEFTVWDSWMAAHKIIAEPTTDTWIDVGTPERYLEIKKIIEDF